jgi:oligopeptide transport system substrate-binding protein
MNKAPSKILSIVVALAVASALFMTAHARSSAHSTQASLPTLKLDYFSQGSGKLANHLDPALVSAAQDAQTLQMAFFGLDYVGTDDKAHLGLAQKYTVSKDRKVYTFTLRPNLKYANGDPIRAGDIKFAIERALAPSTASDVATTYLDTIKGAPDYAAGKVSSVSGLKALNSRTIRFTLDKPYAFFLMQLTYPTSYPLDPKVVSGKTAASTNNFLTTNCPGNAATATGPFKFQCVGSDFYPTGQTPSYTLVPNKNFYGPKPKIKVVLPAVSTLQINYNAYLAGSIDATSIPSGFISQWKKNKQYRGAATSSVTEIAANFHLAPFNNVHCRLAVEYAINRNLISSKIYHGVTHPYYTVVPPGFLGAYSGSDSPHYNLTKAKAEFNACGSGKSTPVKLVYNTGNADRDNAWGEMANELRQAGFNATVDAKAVNDWANIVSEPLDKTNTQLVRNGWQQDYPDPQDYITTLLRCGNIYDIGGFCNTKFNSLVDQADVEANSKKRAALYIQAQRIAISQGAWIPLYYNHNDWLLKPYVNGLVLTVAYGYLTPKNFDWSNVTVSKH